MKHTYILSILLGCFLIFSSCSDKTLPAKKNEELNQPSVGDDIPSEVATEVFDKAPITSKNAPQMGELEEDCHGKRMVRTTLESVDGSILKVGDRYVISTENGNNRYNPCDLPKKFLVGGMLVRFSGDVLEIFPNERLIATPFRTKNIVERDK